MQRSALVVMTVLAASAACRDGPVDVQTNPNDPFAYPNVAVTSADVLRVRDLAEDEFLHEVVGGMENKVLAQRLTKALRDLATAAGTEDPASVLRVLAGQPIDEVWEDAADLSPDDKVALGVFEIMHGYVEWWLTTSRATEPTNDPTVNGPVDSGLNKEIERSSAASVPYCSRRCIGSPRLGLSMHSRFAAAAATKN